MPKSGLYEPPPRRQFKDYFCYFTIWLIYQLVHDIPSDRGIANLFPSGFLSCIMPYYFFGCS